MTDRIPDSHRDLLERPIFVTLVTQMPNGWSQASIVWCMMDGEDILINTAVGRQKDRNMRRNPKVTVLAMDPEDGYRFIEVRGEITEMIDGDETVIDTLAGLYTEHQSYFGGYTPEAQRHTRVTYRIKPVHVVLH